MIFDILRRQFLCLEIKNLDQSDFEISMFSDVNGWCNNEEDGLRLVKSNFYHECN